VFVLANLDDVLAASFKNKRRALIGHLEGTGIGGGALEVFELAEHCLDNMV